MAEGEEERLEEDGRRLGAHGHRRRREGLGEEGREARQLLKKHFVYLLHVCLLLVC